MGTTALLIFLGMVRGMAMGSADTKCAGLAASPLGKGVRIDSAKMVPATATTPEHCEVAGMFWPEAKFAVKLPTAWNNRFFMVGNGGTAGTVSVRPMDTQLRKGYATASTDTGHDAAKEELAVFAYPSPNNPNARRKLIDFAYLSVHETAVLAKKIIKAYYGEAPRYSYWASCSTGGRQGLMEAQRFPEDFDGLVVGCPVLNATGNTMRRIWIAQAQAGAGAIAVEKLPVLAHAVYRKCDGFDGLEDGLIDDPRQCTFDPTRDLPPCPGDTDGPACFTPEQIAALKKIYGGTRNSSGKLLFPGQPLGSEIAAPRSRWEDAIVAPSKVILPRAESYMKFMMLSPPPGPSWNYRMYNFDTDPPKMARIGKILNATNPDLRRLKRRGGKIIHYHGWADQTVNALPSIDYYESVRKKMGDQATREFYRLYMVPGMFHCNGATGCGSVDWVTPVVDWVEKGTAPDALIGAHIENGETRRTRPICPYPQVARYKGSGSIDAAENFTCVAPRPR